LFADGSLSKAAIDALAKISAVLPSEQRNNMGAVPLRVGPPSNPLFQIEDLSIARDAIRRERKVEISYRNGEGRQSTRTVWPFAIGYFPDCRIVVAHYPRRRDEMFRTWKRTVSHSTDN
jgi:predicted DNA-binding transcriptional regulator YafY